MNRGFGGRYALRGAYAVQPHNLRHSSTFVIFRGKPRTSSFRGRPESSSCCSFATTDQDQERSGAAFIGWALAHRVRAVGQGPPYAFDSGVPLGAARTRRKKPAGWPAGCRPVRCQAMDGLSANLRSGLAQSAGFTGRPRPRGCPSLWLLSLGQARESDSLARDGE